MVNATRLTINQGDTLSEADKYGLYNRRSEWLRNTRSRETSSTAFPWGG